MLECLQVLLTGVVLEYLQVLLNGVMLLQVC